MEIQTRQYKVLEKTEIELIDDVWKRCDAHNWTSGILWDQKIAPHSVGTLVKVTTQLIPEHKIVDVEEVTDEMIKKVFDNPSQESDE